MTKFDPEILKQEVNELTSLLRYDESWSDLRNALLEKGMNADRVVLAGFMEDEDGHEFGAIIASNLQVFEYERNTNAVANTFSKWRSVTDIHELLTSFPAVVVGLEIARQI